MLNLILNELSTADIERDHEYLIMYNDEDKNMVCRFATYYYESESDMHLLLFDENNSIEVGEEFAIFEHPLEVDMIDVGKSSPEDIIEDGFGGVWSIVCPVCKQRSMAVMRPGKVQCMNCG